MLARACCRSRGGRCQVSTRQDLIHVSGGELLMGSDGFYPEESPITRVLIDDLWIQSTLVTNAEFSDFVMTTGYVTTAEREDLKQAQNDPFTVEDQTAIIYAGSKNLLRKVPVDQVKAFEKTYIEELNKSHRKVLDTIKSGKLTDEVLDTLNAVAAKIAAQFE